jgi:hypothetical protein
MRRTSQTIAFLLLASIYLGAWSWVLVSSIAMPAIGAAPARISAHSPLPQEELKPVVAERRHLPLTRAVDLSPDCVPPVAPLVDVPSGDALPADVPLDLPFQPHPASPPGRAPPAA